MKKPIDNILFPMSIAEATEEKVVDKEVNVQSIE